MLLRVCTVAARRLGIVGGDEEGDAEGVERDLKLKEEARCFFWLLLRRGVLGVDVDGLESNICFN